jgi:GTP-binding protein
MKIISAEFIKGIVADDEVLRNGIPQVAFIGRSNAGKSSTINALTKNKKLSKTSSFPGRTREINIFLINNTSYLVDLPGYGFAHASGEMRDKIQNLISGYLFDPKYHQEKVVLIIDAKVGPTKSDLEVLTELVRLEKNIVVAVNKVDKVKSSEYSKQMKNIRELIGEQLIVPYSAETGEGVDNLANAVFF